MIRFLDIESGYKLLKVLSDDIEGYIERIRYFHISNDWLIVEKIKDIMSKQKVSLVPVFCENSELMYFAYDLGNMNSELETVLECLEERNADIFLENIYPYMKGVRLYDFNEWAVRFYKILKRHQIGVEVLGEKWRVLFPDQVRFKLNIPEANIMKIWVEGNSRFLDLSQQSCEQGWWFLHSLGIQNHIWITEKYVKKYSNIGIHILTGYFPRSLSKLTLEEEYRSKMNVFMGGPKQLWENENTKQQLCKVYGKDISYEECSMACEEKHSEYIYIDGKAIETKIYGNASNRIYLVGPCIVRGTTVIRDDETLGACLWQRLKRDSISYSVVCVIFDMHEFTAYDKFFEYLTITENDIVIVLNHQDVKDYIEYTNDIPMKDIFERRNSDWFYDIPIHTNTTGNQEIACVITEHFLFPIIKNVKMNPKYLQIGKRMLSRNHFQKLDLYLEKVKSMSKMANKKVKTGSIVMNCNPMTKGHLYLISEARKLVDLLYIFVVEENKSVFQYEERYSFVKNETDKMDNVIVVPSGEFILSASTLPLYFEKAEKRDEKLDASVDLRIFGEYIAPELGITERFVGEEKDDLVTRQYNDQMKNLLPCYGIKVTEIPRLCIDGEPISASTVRKLIQMEEWEKVKMYITENVFQQLIIRMN